MYQQLYPSLLGPSDSAKFTASGLDLPVIKIKPVIAYYLHDRRNAWQYTTVTNYNVYLGANSCFNRFQAACHNAELRRVQGTVFHICEEPALHLVGMNNSLLILHMHTKSPFSGFDRAEVGYEIQRVLAAVPNIHETPRLSFRQMIKLLLPDSKLWRPRLLRHEPILFKYSAEKKTWHDDLKTSPLRQWQSSSFRARENLRWGESPYPVDASAVLDLAQTMATAYFPTPKIEERSS